MALNVMIGHRLHVWSWRIRYWWLDTESGAHAQVMGFCLGALVVLVQTIKIVLASLLAAHAPHPHEPQKAVVWWVVQLVIALVAAVLSYALRPKLPTQPVPKQEMPTVEDGLCVDDHFGEVWIDDPPLLAWKVVRTEKIKSKGGKK